jgi:hypothetical protein
MELLEEIYRMKSIMGLRGNHDIILESKQTEQISLNILTENEREQIKKLHKTYSFGSILTEEVTPEILQQKYVETGKVLMKTFKEIMDVSNNKINYALWLTKMVAENNILPEDVYKYKEYIQIFNKFKKYFTIKDINQINNKKELQEWLNMVIKMREREVTKSDGNNNVQDSKNYVTPNNIQRLENVGIKYMGMVDGYQAFEIPKSLYHNEVAWRTYKNILGKCQGREQGEKIDICTIADFELFNDEISRGSLFLFFNLGDKLSPYQFSYETNQFKDKNDNPLF